MKNKNCNDVNSPLSLQDILRNFLPAKIWKWKLPLGPLILKNMAHNDVCSRMSRLKSSLMFLLLLLSFPKRSSLTWLLLENGKQRSESSGWKLHFYSWLYPNCVASGKALNPADYKRLAKKFVWFFHNIYWKNMNEFFDQCNTSSIKWGALDNPFSNCILQFKNSIE